MTSWKLLVTGMVGLSVMAVPAIAKVKSRISVSYYTVSGSDARTIHSQMVHSGPKVAGHSAYASLQSSPSYDGELVQGSTCRLTDYELTVDFRMILPKLANSNRLSKILQNQWESFERFARRHEERHRTIWIGCMRRAETKILSLKVARCSDFREAANTIVAQEWERCSKLHDAFDQREARRLEHHPLIVSAGETWRRSSNHQVLAVRAGSSPGNPIEQRRGIVRGRAESR